MNPPRTVKVATPDGYTATVNVPTGMRIEEAMALAVHLVAESGGLRPFTATVIPTWRAFAGTVENAGSE